MRDHTKLRAFELADELAFLTYSLTRGFPKEEIYGLTSQMRRAAVSVPSNIVGGCARESQVEYLRFLEIAFGSFGNCIINSGWPNVWVIRISPTFPNASRKWWSPKKFWVP